jgi:hypothetical protein
VALLILPPLAPLTWILLSGAHRGRFLASWLVRVGLAVFLLCPLPLLGVIAAASMGLTDDPNPNPIGFGLLFVAGGVLATILLTAGTFLVERDIRSGA